MTLRAALPRLGLFLGVVAAIAWAATRPEALTAADLEAQIAALGWFGLDWDDESLQS